MDTASLDALPDEVRRLRLNGRANDAQFAQNPLPVLTSMGIALAQLHQRPVTGLESRTSLEVEVARAAIADGGTLPKPYERISRATLLEAVELRYPAFRPVVHTHGAPIVARAVLVDSVTTFDGLEDVGADPAERDLSIVLRSVAETFAPEGTRTLLDAYVNAGGDLPDGRALDWYALIAAFR